MYPQDPATPPPQPGSWQPPQPPPYPPGGYGPGYPAGVPAAPPKRGASNGLVVGLVLGVVVVLLLCGGLTIGAFVVFGRGRPSEPGSSAQEDSRFVDYRKTDPSILTRNHRSGTIDYSVRPPVGGDHNEIWQNCEGDVYPGQIPAERAVHSLEHGAVWIAHGPDVDPIDVDRLTRWVQGKDYMFMSLYPGLGREISLQAWGYQFRTTSPSDTGIGEFIERYRRTASLEPGATCGSGSTALGAAPD